MHLICGFSDIVEEIDIQEFFAAMLFDTLLKYFQKSHFLPTVKNKLVVILHMTLQNADHTQATYF